MDLRTQVVADLPTFVNVGEFANVVDIDGVSMSCVLVNDEAPSSGEGVTVLESTLYARASDFYVSAPPVVRQRITVDGRQANITRVDEEQGMLVIRLQWFNS
jgi:hypothetical protein